MSGKLSELVEYAIHAMVDGKSVLIMACDEEAAIALSAAVHAKAEELGLAHLEWLVTIECIECLDASKWDDAPIDPIWARLLDYYMSQGDNK